MIFHQFFTNSLVGLSTSKKNPCRYDTGTAPSPFQHLEEKRKKQNLCFFVFGTIDFKSSLIPSSLIDPLNGGLARHTVNLSLISFYFDKLSLYSISGWVIECSIRFMAEMRSIVWSISNPVNMGPSK